MTHNIKVRLVHVSDLCASDVFTCTHALIVGLTCFVLFIRFLADYLHK